MLDDTAIEKLRSAIRGQVLTPIDEDYETSRKLFNAMIERRPALIIRPTSTPDVVTAVEFAHDRDLEISVKGGGHSIAGKSVCDRGLAIDFSLMKDIHVDPLQRVATAQPGLRLAEFDAVTQQYGLATTMGTVSNTGIAGLTLGGGVGWLNGKHGLACDNLRAAEMVTADGRVVHASSEENPELYWGIRGGSGNFGIVTTFEYRLHPVDRVLAGMLLYPLTSALEVLRFYDEHSRHAPDELSSAAALLNAPDGTPIVGLVFCWCGALEEGAAILARFRSFGTPIADTIASMAYTEAQRLLDVSFPPNQQHYWKTSNAECIVPEFIALLTDAMYTKPSTPSVIVFQQFTGATTRVSPTATAFPHRGYHYDCMFLSMWPDPAQTETNVRWTRSHYEAARPFLEDAVYVNGISGDEDHRVRAAYGPNYDRLVAIKEKYDPENFFRWNHNIAPRAAPCASKGLAKDGAHLGNN